jgi:DNA-directed RNA polymerase subunit RPC12/RpoP
MLDWDDEKMRIEREIDLVRAQLERLGITVLFRCIRCGSLIYSIRETEKHLSCKTPAPKELDHKSVKQHKEYNWISIFLQRAPNIIRCSACGDEMVLNNIKDDVVKDFIDRHKSCQVEVLL